MTPILSNQVWLGLKRETRAKLRALLSIPRTGHVEVFDGNVLCDGTTMEDLQHITLEKLQEALQVFDVSDFYKLFAGCVRMIESPMTMVGTESGKAVDIIPFFVEVSPVSPEIKKKPGRPKKKA